MYFPRIFKERICMQGTIFSESVDWLGSAVERKHQSWALSSLPCSSCNPHEITWLFPSLVCFTAVACSQRKQTSKTTTKSQKLYQISKFLFVPTSNFCISHINSDGGNINVPLLLGQWLKSVIVQGNFQFFYHSYNSM